VADEVYIAAVLAIEQEGAMLATRFGAWTTILVGVFAFPMASQAQQGTAGSRSSTLQVRVSVHDLRADVERVLAAEATAVHFKDRLAAIRQIVEMHDRLVVDPCRPQSVAVRGLERRLAHRLVQVHRDLVAMAAKPCSEQASEQATLIGAGGDLAEAQSLIDLIQATVSPEAWDINGGQGSIRYFSNGRALVVRGPEDVHDALGDLLRQLR